MSAEDLDRTAIEQIISDYVDAWNGDFSKRDVVSESISLDHPNAPEGGIHGRDAFEDDVRGLHEGFPDHHLTVAELLNHGYEVTALSRGF